MTDKTPVPTIAFDPSKHAIAGRRVADGRQLFFSLSSIVAAEKTIEGQPSPATDLAPPAPSVTQSDLDAIEQKVLATVKASVPPPQFPADLMATLTEVTKAAVALKQQNEALVQRVSKLESDNAIWAKNFAGIMSLAGKQA